MGHHLAEPKVLKKGWWDRGEKKGREEERGRERVNLVQLHREEKKE